MKKSLLYFLLLIVFQFTFSLFVQNKAVGQSATTTITYGGFQACGGCTVCGADYWCFNTVSSYCGNTTPCGSQTFSDPVPAGNIVTSVSIDYYSGGCEGSTMTADINGQAVPTVNDANTGCLCSSSPCTVAASSSSAYPCGLPGYNNGGINTLQMCTGTGVCINRLELTFTYAPSNQATPATQPGGISGSTPVCTGSSQTYSIPAVANAASYNWTVPAGWTITSGQNSTSITVTVGSSSGNICVTASNLCGTSAATCFAVTPLPVINATLSSTDACAGTVTINVTGGLPQTSGTNYSVTNTGAGSLSGLPISNNGSFTITGLSNGQGWGVSITDGSCTDVLSGTFSGDAVSPSISCPANINVNNDGGSCGAVVTYTAPVGTDNCPSPVTTQTAGLASGATFPIGTTTNTFLVTDANGNTSSCSFNVVVTDAENPVISCPGNIAMNNDVGACSAVATYTAPVGTDNCPSPVTTQTVGLASGSAFPVGTTTNTFLVTDASGNTATCSFDVVITDTESPAISCPGNMAVNNDVGSCGAVVNYTAPVGTDNCTPTTTQTAGLASGMLFPVGTTTNTFLVTDPAGNTATCSFDVVVTDSENPAISCPGNISQCDSIVSWTAPVGVDNCAGVLTSQTGGLASGSIFPIGISTIEYTSTDAAGNSIVCTFDIEIISAEDASFSYPQGNTYCINDANPIAVIGGVAGGDFTIFPAGIVNSSTGEIDVAATGAGNYTIVYNTAIVGNACPSIDSVQVVITAQGTITPTPVSPICFGDTLVLVATGSGLGTVTWYSDNLGVNVLVTGNNYSPVITGVDTITCYVNEGGSCASPMDSIVVIIQGVSAGVTASPESGFAPLDVQFGNTGSVGNGITYDWDFGDGNFSTDFEPNNIFVDTGSYTVVLFVSDGLCSDSASIEIEIFGESILIIPNIFTPNGDGVNDVFTMQATNITDIQGTIINRWGQVVYQWNAVQAGWDGRTVSGNECAEGAYYYILEAEGGDGEVYKYEGAFQLVR